MDSSMARTRWHLVLEGLRPMNEAQALGSLSGAFRSKQRHTENMSKEIQDKQIGRRVCLPHCEG